MLLPQATDYVAAIQNPNLCFRRSDLQHGIVETDSKGLPRPYSGGFTVTFRMKTTNGGREQNFAVRCFTRAASDLDQRWTAITRFLAASGSEALVAADFLAEGIAVNGNWYPVVKMPWVTGTPLNEFVLKNLKRPKVLDDLLIKISNLARWLEDCGVAHGDLQVGNIIVADGELKLIDYDSWYLPELISNGPSDRGHPDFQHPGRTDELFSTTMDRFAFIVLYAGIESAGARPDLWERFDSRENLIFRKRDFEDPAASLAFAELRKDPAIAALIERVIEICKRPAGEVPALAHFLDSCRGGQVRPAGTPTKLPYTACAPGVIEVVTVGDNTAFLVKEDGEFIVKSTVMDKNVLYQAPPRFSLPWLPPRFDAVMSHLQEMAPKPFREAANETFKKVLTFVRDLVELPGQGHDIALAAWIVHTYLIERFKHTPFVLLVGDSNFGKSRTGTGIIWASRRGIWVEKLEEAHLIRYSTDMGAAMFVDVKDLQRSLNRTQADDVLLARRQRGLTVARVRSPTSGPFEDMAYYKVFGPTIIATNVAPDEKVTSRSLVVNAVKSNRSFVDVTEESVLPLRELLTAFRARALDEQLPECEKPALRRLGDIMHPLAQTLLLVSPEHYPVFLELVEQVKHAGDAQEQPGLLAELVGVLHGLAVRVQHGALPVKVVTEAWNQARPLGCGLTPHRVGRLLGELGFQKRTVGNGSAAIIWNPEFLNRGLDRVGGRDGQQGQ